MTERDTELAKQVAAEVRVDLGDQLSAIRVDIAMGRAEIAHLGEDLRHIAQWFTESPDKATLPARMARIEGVVLGMVSKVDSYDAAAISERTAKLLGRQQGRYQVAVAALAALAALIAAILAWLK